MLALLDAGKRGHYGVPGVIEEALPVYVATVSDTRDQQTATEEFQRFTLDGAAKIMAERLDREYGCDCGEHARPNGERAHIEFPRLATLSNEFYEKRPNLSHIRTAAHARNRAADAVLHAVLARIAAFHLPEQMIHTGIGAPVPLNYSAIFPDPSGAGKSAAERIARELLPMPSALDAQGCVDGAPIGSGQGIAEAYMGTIKETIDGKTKNIHKQVREHALFYVDEGEAYTKISKTEGSILGETIRRTAGGKPLGQYNATEERRRFVRRYAFGMVVAATPAIAAEIIAEAGKGTPQRFGWASATDPSIPETPPEWPGELQGISLSITTVSIDPVIVDELRREDTPYAKGEKRRAVLDSQEPLMRLKLAGLLALLDGRAEITRAVWALARQVYEVSATVRNQTDDYVRQSEVRKRQQQTAAKAREASVITSTQAAVVRVAGVLRNRCQKTRCSYDDLKNAVAGRDRRFFGEARRHALDTGMIVQADDRRYEAGTS